MTEGKKGKCVCFLVIGVLLLALGLFADALGIGADPSFGPKQIAASVVGVILILVGLTTCKFCKCAKGSDT